MGESSANRVVTAVVIEDGHILMVRQGSGYDRGRWNLPGGRASPGENLLLAVRREALEESGYRVNVGGIVGIYPFVTRSGRDSQRYVMKCRIVGGTPRCDGKEITDVRWFDLAQATVMKSSQLAKPTLLRKILSDAANHTARANTKSRKKISRA